jgi:hypothetical protein
VLLYTKLENVTQDQRRLEARFNTHWAPCRNIFPKLLKRFLEEGTVLESKRQRKPSARTPEISEALNNATTKSRRKSKRKAN